MSSFKSNENLPVHQSNKFLINPLSSKTQLNVDVLELVHSA